MAGKLFAGLTYEQAVRKYADTVTGICVMRLQNMSDAQACILSDNTQQDIDEAILEVESMLAKAKLKEADEDIVLFDEFYKIYEAMQQESEKVVNAEFDFANPEFKDFDGYRIVRASSNICFPVIYKLFVDGYIFESVNEYYPYGLALCAVNAGSGNVLKLEDAINNGYVSADEFFSYYLKNKNTFSFKMGLCGDINQDYVLNINDVTLLQRCLADITTVKKSSVNNYDFYSYDITDCNNDGKSSVNDVTQIQRKLANITG